jgi:hypothetical protein
MAEENWLTYAELAEALGISIVAARSLAKRHKWPRRVPNAPGSVALILVPEDRVRPKVDPLRDLPSDLPATHPDPGSTYPDPRSIVDRSETDPGPSDLWTDPGPTHSVDLGSKAIEVFQIELAASRARADQLQAAFDAKEAEYQKIIAQLTDEVSEQRRLTAMLVEKLTARRRWWPWLSKL